MHIMYVDESGDPGIGGSPHYVLSGLIVPITCWNASLDQLKGFRRGVRQQYGLSMREELHAAELIRIGKTVAYRSIRKRDRIAILRDLTAQLPTLCAGAHLINVCFDKATLSGTPANCKSRAWSRLLTRYDTFLQRCGLPDAHGVVIADGAEDTEVRGVLRRLRVFNPVPSRYGSNALQRPTQRIIEDVIPRDSKHSYFIQAVDAVAHTLYRQEYPKGALKKHKVERFFGSMAPLFVTAASRHDRQGVVRT